MQHSLPLHCNIARCQQFSCRRQHFGTVIATILVRFFLKPLVHMVGTLWDSSTGRPGSWTYRSKRYFSIISNFALEACIFKMFFYYKIIMLVIWFRLNHTRRILKDLILEYFENFQSGTDSTNSLFSYATAKRTHVGFKHTLTLHPAFCAPSSIISFVVLVQIWYIDIASCLGPWVFQL
jgi:hypothetical protein